MTPSQKRKLLPGVVAVLLVWALYGIYLANESRRDVRQIHRDVQDEVNMDENSARLHEIVIAHPNIWMSEHPRNYDALMWVFVRHDLISTAQAKIYISFDQACSPDYRILLKYVRGENEPHLTNSRIEVLGIR